MIQTVPVSLRRLLPALTGLTLLAAACGGSEFVVETAEEEGVAFYPQVVDFEADAGRGVSITTDADGNPHMTYLVLPEEPAEGEAEAPPQPGDPVPPLVRHAHLVEGVWTRSEVAQDQQELTEADQTAIAVDADGTHHVAWTAGGALFYANNSEGEFSEPQPVSEADVAGISIAAVETTPWIAFYELQSSAEGPGALVRAATLDGDEWQVETVAEADASEPFSTGIVAGLAGPIVAFGDAAGAVVASLQGGAWRSETADPDAAGVGVSMAIDADGNPHLGYLTSEGTVRHANSVGGWEISDLGSGSSESPASIAVDPDGIHHVAWQTDEGIAFATNEGGEFAEQDLPAAAQGGVHPRLAAGSGSAYLAWYDPENTELQMATRSEDEPLLAVPPPEEEATGGTAPEGETCEPQGEALQLGAPPGAAATGFDTTCLAVTAGQAYTINLTNQDSAPHNVSVYTDESAAEPLLQGEIVDPGASGTAEGEPVDEAGSFFFRCDLHPTTMTGTFVVAGGDEGGGGGGGGGGEDGGGG